ncbi:MAG: response regulator transcription factor [Planctomycetota bacterium]
MQILLVEDDRKLGREIAGRLGRHGYDVTWDLSGDDALVQDPERFDLVTLDLMLPGVFGLDVLRSFRKRSGVPILVLSGKRDAAVRVRALELGADDYLTKPFWPDELLARVRARLRRPVLQRERQLPLGELVLDLERRTVTRGDAELDLTRAEYELFAALARRAGSAVQRGWLAERILEPGRDDDRALDVHVSRLRRKLGDCGRYVRTVWGVGYRLELDTP